MHDSNSRVTALESANGASWDVARIAPFRLPSTYRTASHRSVMDTYSPFVVTTKSHRPILCRILARIGKARYGQAAKSREPPSSVNGTLSYLYCRGTDPAEHRISCRPVKKLFDCWKPRIRILDGSIPPCPKNPTIGPLTICDPPY